MAFFVLVYGIGKKPGTTTADIANYLSCVMDLHEVKVNAEVDSLDIILHPKSLFKGTLFRFKDDSLKLEKLFVLVLKGKRPDIFDSIGPDSFPQGLLDELAPVLDVVGMPSEVDAAKMENEIVLTIPGDIQALADLFSSQVRARLKPV